MSTSPPTVLRRLAVPLAGLAAVATLAATPHERPARVLGTIEATVDGEAHTWYVVEGESGGKPYASGVWMSPTDGKRTVSAGGYDTDDPPLDSFEWSEQGFPLSFGDYEGSTFNVMVRVPEGSSSLEVALTGAEGGFEALVSWQPVATLENPLESTWVMTSGTLRVTEVAVEDGRARMEGTFSGTLGRMDGQGTTREVSGGRFRISGLPSADEIRR
ncbi:MAG: hypothetical protein PVI57_03950 [Gemmatimonadota bacterium]|jgi:hypothetical protein